MNSGKKKTTLILLIVGIVLIVAAIAVVVFSELSAGKAESDCKALVAKLRELMPENYAGQPDDRVNLSMPMVEVDGKNYVGIVQLPKYDRELPVSAQWDANAVTATPCRYTGSIYDGTLIIGGSDNDGQFDFMKLITMGDEISVTDMTGGKYRYTVTWVENSKDVSTQALSGGDDALVIFARNTYSLDNTIVRCARR